MEEIFKDIRNTTFDYSKKITSNKYTQDINKSLDVDDAKYYKSIYELILSIKDINYTILNHAEVDSYVKTTILSLCNSVDTEYDKYNLDNGILLAKHLHSAFDKRYFTFDQKSSKVKILYNNLEKMNITNLNTIGLEDMDGLYIPQLDNKESRIYLSMINNLYI